MRRPPTLLASWNERSRAWDDFAWAAVPDLAERLGVVRTIVPMRALTIISIVFFLGSAMLAGSVVLLLILVASLLLAVQLETGAGRSVAATHGLFVGILAASGVPGAASAIWTPRFDAANSRSC